MVTKERWPNVSADSPCRAPPKRYVFDCPVHGLEIGVHCHRARDPQNLTCWFVCRLRLRRPADEELEETKPGMGMQGAS